MANYRERLRRIAVNDPRQLAEDLGTAPSSGLDPRTLSLARLSALIAMGGSEPTFAEYTDAALSAGATCDEIVDVLIGIGTVVGAPRVVSASTPLALALGVDVDID